MQAELGGSPPAAGAYPVPRDEPQLGAVLQKHVACRLLRVDADTICRRGREPGRAPFEGWLAGCRQACRPESRTPKAPGSLSPLVMMALVAAGTLNCRQAGVRQAPLSFRALSDKADWLLRERPRTTVLAPPAS